MEDDTRRTTPRPQMARDPKFDDVSPDVGQIDEDALAELAAEDPDHALSMLADMRTASDQQLARLASRLAGRLVLEVARTGSVRARGIGTIMSSPADRAEGDLDIDRSLDALVTAKGTHSALDLSELRVRHWTRPSTAVALVVDRSGSMSGRRLATAAVAAAACAHRAPVDWSVLAFADRIIAVKSQNDSRAINAVVDDLLRLRGQGTTDLAGALEAAARQLERSRAKRRITILMSDCRATAGVDALPVACRLDELCVLAPAEDDEDAVEFAARAGARMAVIDGPTDIPHAIRRLLEG